MQAMHELPVALSCRRVAALPNTPNQRHPARIPPPQEGRFAIVMNVRWDAVAATGRETSAPLADGEAVWFWRPEAGVKFARRQRVARMTGSTKRWSPGRARKKP